MMYCIDKDLWEDVKSIKALRDEVDCLKSELQKLHCKYVDGSHKWGPAEHYTTASNEFGIPVKYFTGYSMEYHTHVEKPTNWWKRKCLNCGKEEHTSKYTAVSTITPEF